MFKACFTPPALPQFVLAYFASNPSTWTWTTKDGPNKGKSFQVPTIPITCDKAAPKAIHWMVATFHLYKAHLNPIAIDKDSGRVKQGWLRLYQNNMCPHPPPSHSPPQCPNPEWVPSTTANPLEHVLVELQKELQELQERFTNYISSHEACCMHRNHSPSQSSLSEDGHNDNVPPNPPPVPHLYILSSDGSGIPDPNPPSWLITALSNPGIPPMFKEDVFSPDPISNNPLPSEVVSAIKLIFEGASPLYLGLLRDRSLILATTARHDAVVTTL
ncbi:hypothetical protein EDC04DRAFT_2605891 [Pisolithus marmoratus]|nr:hypothetical protein EDC04DRAFT_2605891 [Pisolithus marmoratus]